MAMTIIVILILIVVIYIGYCIWDFVRSKYRPLKEENEDSKSKEES
jgi:ABC-type bacteriocin/lantibiotic exporter with double-glycine peptidase domain